MTNLAVLGHNKPSPADLTRDLDAEIRAFVTEHPVIQDEDEARKAANIVQRAKNTLADLDAERKAKGRPHLDSIHAINTEYHDAMRPINLGKETVEERLTDYAKAEELRRQEIAEKVRLEAIAAQERASQAIRDAYDAEANAAVGEAVDVVSLKQEAVAAFNDARRADRAFARAERDAGHVRLATGLGRALAPRKHTELSVTDAAAAIGAIGLTEGIAEAILTAARSYKKLKGNYPPGIAVNTTRTI